MKRIFAISMLAVIFSSCAGLPAWKTSQIPQQTTFAYTCDKNAQFTAVYDKEKDLFYITGFKGMRVLKRAMSASGARYIDGQMTYWSKGDTATLEFKGKTYTCSVDAKMSAIEDAKSRGVEYMASDDEKTWLLEISKDTVTLYMGSGAEKYVFDKAEKSVRSKKTNINAVNASKDGHTIEVVIGGEKCHGKSKQADITFDRIKLVGCGVYIE